MINVNLINCDVSDPTYMIRAIPSNASDNVYCTLLAHSAIHGAMAGYCGFIAGPVNSRHCYLPIKVSHGPTLLLAPYVFNRAIFEFK